MIPPNELTLRQALLGYIYILQDTPAYGQLTADERSEAADCVMGCLHRLEELLGQPDEDGKNMIIWTMIEMRNKAIDPWQNPDEPDYLKPLEDSIASAMLDLVRWQEVPDLRGKSTQERPVVSELQHAAGVKSIREKLRKIGFDA